MKSTSGKKFKPNQVISGKEYDTMLKRLVKAAGESENAYKLGEGDFFGDEDISRQQAIHFLYLAYQATKDTDYLATTYMDDRAVNYTISPADNKNLFGILPAYLELIFYYFCACLPCVFHELRERNTPFNRIAFSLIHLIARDNKHFYHSVIGLF